ncbi:hypothetical protein E2C01_088425 [Portunus trituberculatus]|uniref:Uncharacterized protein n=1 Tax=Portunus trituberculatus TaxID=210409 RepID=A0A5B7J654_PORTR|nr:hypothetical protein [Portunus trituberculatus]
MPDSLEYRERTKQFEAQLPIYIFPGAEAWGDCTLSPAAVTKPAGTGRGGTAQKHTSAQRKACNIGSRIRFQGVRSTELQINTGSPRRRRSDHPGTLTENERLNTDENVFSHRYSG